MKCDVCERGEVVDFGLCAPCVTSLNEFIAPYASIHHALRARDEVIAAGFRKVTIDRWKSQRNAS